jgi:phosphopantetheinyl transferase
MALLYKKNIALGTKLGIWKREESLELLESIYTLNSSEKNEYELISNENRKKEWLTTRILLTEILQQKIEICHTEYGKPFLLNHNSNISISHSKNFIAIVTSSNYNIGVDIEFISNRVSKVKSKFLTPNELKWCNNLNQQTACWSAKESIFKIYEKELDFFDINIDKFEINKYGGSIKAFVLKNNKHFNLRYMFIENDILIYVIDKN